MTVEIPPLDPLPAKYWPLIEQRQHPNWEMYAFFGLSCTLVPGGVFLLSPFTDVTSGRRMSWWEVSQASGVTLPETAREDPWGFSGEIAGDLDVYLPECKPLDPNTFQRVTNHLLELSLANSLDDEVCFFNSTMEILAAPGRKIPEKPDFEAGTTSLRELLQSPVLPQAIWDPGREFYLTRMFEDASNYLAGPEALTDAVASDPQIETIRWCSDPEDDTPANGRAAAKAPEQ